MVTQKVKAPERIGRTGGLVKGADWWKGAAPMNSLARADGARKDILELCTPAQERKHHRSLHHVPMGDPLRRGGEAQGAAPRARSDRPAGTGSFGRKKKALACLISARGPAPEKKKAPDSGEFGPFEEWRQRASNHAAPVLRDYARLRMDSTAAWAMGW